MKYTIHEVSISGLTAVPPTSLSGTALLILGGLRRRRDRKLGFSMFWALGGPLGAQEGQNHMLQDAQLHFDLVPAPIDLRFDISSRPLLFFLVQELLQFSSIAVF